MSAAESARLRDSGIVTPAWLYRPQLDPITPITDAVVRRVSAAAATPHPAEARDWRRAQVPASAITSMAQLATPPARAGRPDDVTLARLAQAVYSDGASLPSGWGEATSLDMRAIGVRSADLVAADSGFRARVYAEGTGADRRFVIAFRGSTSGRGDWISNGRQSAGLPSDHYRAALLVGQGLAQRRSAARVTLTGHSLGGGLASAAALAAGRDSVTFNAAGLSRRTIGEARRIASDNGAAGMPDIRAYHVRGELLSAIQDGGDRMFGALLGALVAGNPAGSAVGLGAANVPEAYGERVPLDPVRPVGTPWWRDSPGARHGMDYVLSSLGAR